MCKSSSQAIKLALDLLQYQELEQAYSEVDISFLQPLCIKQTHRVLLRNSYRQCMIYLAKIQSNRVCETNFIFYNPQNQQVEIYRLGKPVEIVQLPILLSGEEVLPGFELQF